MESVRKILQGSKNRYSDNTMVTHTSLDPKGSYIMSRETTDEFLNLYCKLIYEDKKHEKVFTITEVVNRDQKLPILVDIDLEVRAEDFEDREVLYTEDQLKQLVAIYQSVIRQTVENLTEQDLVCVVLQKELYQRNRGEDSYLKHGFHLHFPIFLDRTFQEVQIIPRVQEAVKNAELFKDLGIEDSSTVIDKQCTRNPWLLYGGRKNADAKPYLVTKIYDAELNEITLEKAFSRYQIFDHNEELITVKGKVEFYLPRILSTWSNGRREKTVKRSIISPLRQKLKRERASSEGIRHMSYTEAIKVCKELLPLLSEERARLYEDWISIGWALYNITEGTDEGMQLWIDFSARCNEKFDENECISKWDKMKLHTNGYTIGTIRRFARLDNEEEYRKHERARAAKYIRMSIEGSHNDIARALCELYGDEFVCTSMESGKRGTWYHFNGNIWRQDEMGASLCEKISTTVFKQYKDMEKKLNEEKHEDDGKEEDAEVADKQAKYKASMLDAQIKKVKKLQESCKNNTFKNSVMKECTEVFRDRDGEFLRKLDANTHLIAFRNGVYDLANNKFRQGKPDDYLSGTLPIDYQEYSLADEGVQELLSFFEKVFPDKTVRKYFLDLNCEIFVGGNPDKILQMWTGEANGGKSATQTLFESMLGSLAAKAPTTMITGKKVGAGSANAEMARLAGGVRWVAAEEPDEDEAIRIGTIKSLTGNDSQFARDLFEKGKQTREFKPMFKFIFICNKLPRVRSADGAIWIRTRVIPFESTFVLNPADAPATPEEQLAKKTFPADKQFNRKIPNLTGPLAWYLIDYRRRKGTDPIIEPSRVLEATDLYRKQNDLYLQFTQERIYEDKNDASIQISLADLYMDFKFWLQSSIPNATIPSRMDVEDHYLGTKVWGPSLPGKIWTGRRLRTVEDDKKAGLLIVAKPYDPETDETKADEEPVKVEKKKDEEKTKEEPVKVEKKKEAKNVEDAMKDALEKFDKEKDDGWVLDDFEEEDVIRPMLLKTRRVPISPAFSTKSDMKSVLKKSVR